MFVVTSQKRPTYHKDNQTASAHPWVSEARCEDGMDIEPREARNMRWLHTAVIAILIGGILIFAVQNLQSVTVSFLNLKISAPLAVLFALVYVLGMVTGGSTLALIRWAMDRPDSSS